MARGIKVFDKETLALAAGGATSGFITGFIRPMLGGFVEPVPGILEIAVGYAGARFLGKKGLMRAYFKGVMVAGLANAIASFIPQVTGTFPSGKAARQYTDGKVSQYPRGGLYIERSPGFETGQEDFTAFEHYMPTRGRNVGKGIDVQ